MSLSLPAMRSAIAEHAAFRRRQRLQPMGGAGDKVFPPTYPGDGRNAPPQHVFERRRVPGKDQDVWCVLLDSVQSQANRLEETLLQAARSGTIPLPMVVVDFAGAGLGELTSISSLEAPHRIFDAILRDSMLDGTPFMASPLGRNLQLATVREATAIFEVSPSALIFGAWNSTGEGGGLGAKFPRCLTSEIMGVAAPVEETRDRAGDVSVRSAGRRTGSRIDPLGILRSVPVYKSKTGWDIDKNALGKDAKPARPSEINHGNIAPTVTPLGVTFDYAEHIAVLSLAGLRRLSFGAEERNDAARSMLASLALLALLEQERQGYSLRSRCELVVERPAELELVHGDGSIEPVDVNLDDARKIYRETFDAAKKAGFALSAEPMRLTPQPKLVKIVQMSREAALRGEGGEESAADATA